MSEVLSGELGTPEAKRAMRQNILVHVAGLRHLKADLSLVIERGGDKNVIQHLRCTLVDVNKLLEGCPDLDSHFRSNDPTWGSDWENDVLEWFTKGFMI